MDKSLTTIEMDRPNPNISKEFFVIQRLVLIFSTIVIGVPSAHAVDLFNNLSQTPSEQVQLTTSAGAGNWQYNAEAFTTDSLNLQLTGVTLKLGLGALGSTTGSFDVAIWSNNTSGSPANSPGNLVATVATGTALDVFSSSTGLLTFTPTSLIQLSPNQTYWVVLNASSYTGTRQIVSFGTTSSAGVSVTSNMMLQSLNGIGWSQNSPSTGTSHMLMQVTAVPEPSTYILGCIATGLTGVLIRRRRTS